MTEQSGVGWRGMSFLQIGGDEEGELAPQAGALGRKYIAFDSRKIQKITVEPIKNYYFPCISRKTSLLISCFLTQMPMTSFQKQLKYSFCL